MYCRPNTVQRTIRYDNCSLLSTVLIIFLDNSSRVIAFIINCMLKNKFITVFYRFIFLFFLLYRLWINCENVFWHVHSNNEVNT